MLEEQRTSKRQLDIYQQELQASQHERMVLAAQVEASRLDSVVASALTRNRASLTKLVSPGPSGSGDYPPLGLAEDLAAAQFATPNSGR